MPPTTPKVGPDVVPCGHGPHASKACNSHAGTATFGFQESFYHPCFWRERHLLGATNCVGSAESRWEKKIWTQTLVSILRSVALICWGGEPDPWPDHVGLLLGNKSPPGFEKPLTIQNFPPALFPRIWNRIIASYRACPNAPVLHKDVKCSKISGMLGFKLVNTILSREIISSVCRLQ